MPPESPRIADLRRRVEAEPTSIAFAQLAEEYRRAGNYQAAEQTCRTGLARHPGYLSARVTLGRTLIERGDLEGAEAELQFVLKGAADNLAAIRGMAEIFQRRGDLVNALEFYRRALPLARQDPELEETVSRIDRDLHAVRAAAPVVGLSFEEAQSELLDALARMPEVLPSTPTPTLVAAVAPTPTSAPPPALAHVPTPTPTPAPEPIIVRPEDFPALVAPAEEPVSPDISLLDQPTADPHGMDFESLLQALGAPDHPTPPTIDALLSPSVTHADPGPIVPELPSTIAEQDPFASLEEALRQPVPSLAPDPQVSVGETSPPPPALDLPATVGETDPTAPAALAPDLPATVEETRATSLAPDPAASGGDEPASAYDPFAGFDEPPSAEQATTGDGERPPLSDDPFARFPEPDAASRAHDPIASLDEATPAAITADPFARFDDPPSLAPDRFASFGETSPPSLAPDRFASFGESSPPSPVPDQFATLGETHPPSLVPDQFASVGETHPPSPEPAVSTGDVAAFPEPDVATLAPDPTVVMAVEEAGPALLAEPHRASVVADALFDAAVDDSALASDAAVLETAVATMQAPPPSPQNVLDELEAWLAAIKR